MTLKQVPVRIAVSNVLTYQSTIQRIMILSTSQRIYTAVLLNSYFLFLSQRTTFHSVLTSKLLLFPPKNLLVSRFSVFNIFSTQLTVHRTLVYRTQYSTHYKLILKSPSIHSRTSYCETKVVTGNITLTHQRSSRSLFWFNL